MCLDLVFIILLSTHLNKTASWHKLAVVLPHHKLKIVSFTYVDNDLNHVKFIIKRLTFDIFDDDDEEEKDFDYDDMK